MKLSALANTVMRPRLKSSLHAILSNRLMLLSYVGGKTGTKHDFAVGYFPWDDGDVLVLSSINSRRSATQTTSNCSSSAAGSLPNQPQ